MILASAGDPSPPRAHPPLWKGAEGQPEIGSTEREQRLRAVAHVSRLIAETFDARTVQAWMQGMDPMLDDRSPAWVLRHATDGTERAAVLASARRFIVQ